MIDLTKVQAKNEGTRAFYDGDGENPYQRGTLRFSYWQEGYDAAAAHHAQLADGK